MNPPMAWRAHGLHHFFSYAQAGKKQDHCKMDGDVFHKSYRIAQQFKVFAGSLVFIQTEQVNDPRLSQSPFVAIFLKSETCLKPSPLCF